jgi:hypothetical protein
MSDRQQHWEGAYATNGPEAVSWYEPSPAVSLELLEALGVGAPTHSLLDVGGGASRLADALLGQGWEDVTVLDISAGALETVRRRLPAGSPVTFIAHDLLIWTPTRRYTVWHDRAVLHFMVEPSDRRRYREVLAHALEPGGAVIIGTFALDGPERCSGLPVVRSSPDDLMELLGDDFEVVTSRRHEHQTPGGAVQPFTWVAARARG